MDNHDENSQDLQQLFDLMGMSSQEERDRLAKAGQVEPSGETMEMALYRLSNTSGAK